MINSANLCVFEGRIARDPQYSTIQVGQESVEKALFSIAVDRALSTAQRQKVKAGDQTIKTVDFIPCSLLGASVATLRQFYPKGKAIRIICHYTEYQMPDPTTGQTKYGHMFEVDNISFTVSDSKNLQNGQQGTQAQQGYQQDYQQPQQGYQQNYQYQQAPQQHYQAPPQQQQPQGNNFAMFDETTSPF